MWGTVITLAYVACIYVFLPTGIVLGWTRVSKPQSLDRSVPGWCAFVGFAIASVSAALGIASMLYARVHPFRYYDPHLMQIYRWGFLLSLFALLVSLGGIWRHDPVRWLAPLCALGTLIFWIGAAATE